MLAAEFLQSELADLYYPMLYCFRHYVELSLKSLVELYTQALDENIKDELRAEHGLMRLWNELKRLVVKGKALTRDGDNTSKNVERCINELNKIDRLSQSFRYDRDRTGKSFNDRLPDVRLDRFVGTMENLHAFFEGCAMQAEDWLECKEDMRSYYQADYDPYNSY